VIPPETNIVIFEASNMSALELTRRLREEGVLALAIGETKVRMVTHLDVNRADIERTIDVIGEILA
jgi:threonine aldolase